jgi:hypothetical protein
LKCDWLSKFLELLTTSVRDLHFQFLSVLEPSTASLRLSRFMPLSVFIRNHTDEDSSASLIDRFRDRLSPRLTKTIRRNSKIAGELAEWHGSVGSYPDTRGRSIKYTAWCARIKPFATLSEIVEASYDRLSAPDRILQQLGIPFSSGEYWIELTYAAQNAAFFSPTDRKRHLAIPTPTESAGNWAFRPDRDGMRTSNYARDLKTGDRGLPEIVHELFDIELLDDFLVWDLPTTTDWPNPTSPYVLSSHP